MPIQTTSTITRCGTLASLPFAQEIISLCYDLRWMMLLCLALIIADFKFGIENSAVHKRPIRFSNAWRRTINKTIDYVCWLIVAGLLGKALAEPFGISSLVVATVVVLIAAIIEIDSIIQNYFEARGIYGMSLKVLLGAWARIKSPQTAETLDESFKDVHRVNDNDDDNDNRHAEQSNNRQND